MPDIAQTTLGIFARHPKAGNAKTRLAAEVGSERAREIYAAFVEDILARFADVGDERYVCFAPDGIDARRYFEERAGPRYSLWHQPTENLGSRMQSFFEHHLRPAGHRLVVIGSDSPTLPRELIDRAFDELSGADCVLGPAADGGYYLVGMQGRVWPLFDNVEWSGPLVLDQTVRNVRAAGARLALLPVWYDVDTIADLLVLSGHLRALAAAGSSITAEATRRVLGCYDSSNESLTV